MPRQTNYFGDSPVENAVICGILTYDEQPQASSGTEAWTQKLQLPEDLKYNTSLPIIWNDSSMPLYK